MKSTEKNLLIFALIGIGFIFIWTFSSYKKTNDKKNELKNYQANQESPENKLQKEINSLPSITTTELKNINFDNSPFIIVDARDEMLYKKGHITESVHISTLDTNRAGGNIILVTENGNESDLLSIYKSLAKSNEVKILTGGFNAWNNSGGSTVSFGDLSSFVDQAKVHLIEPRNINEIYSKFPNKITIIDVRKKADFEKSHIPGAINVPISELEKRHREISTTKKVCIYGAEEISSFNAGVMIYDLGFFDAKTINGGFAAWQKYEYPVETNLSS